MTDLPDTFQVALKDSLLDFIKTFVYPPLDCRLGGVAFPIVRPNLIPWRESADVLDGADDPSNVDEVVPVAFRVSVRVDLGLLNDKPIDARALEEANRANDVWLARLFTQEPARAESAFGEQGPSYEMDPRVNGK